MDLAYGDKNISGLTKINVLMGKNGCGKSTLLRLLDENLRRDPNMGAVRYITPERGGVLTFDGNVETNLQNSDWGDTVRRANRNEQFRQMSVSEFRRLETLVLRRIEADEETRRSAFTFESTISKINALLSNVQITRSDDAGFQAKWIDGTLVRTSQMSMLSSGESELISLATEILSFAYRSSAAENAGKTNIILLDEPDVHLHPDLQDRLVRLMIDVASEHPVTIILATHSTAILGALSDYKDAAVAFMRSKEKNVRFERIGNELKSVLPVFGAHPLSNVFNQSPILLVEGEDDERIWQQAVRSSQGRIRLWPCAAGDVQSLGTYEAKVAAISASIYDSPKCYSLRDRDEGPYEIEDLDHVHRMRLFCRASENLILSDDVLHLLGTTWEAMVTGIEAWLLANPDHKQTPAMKEFKDGGFQRREANLKDLRNIIMTIAGSSKPWEVAVGQAIARLNPVEGNGSEHSLTAYLGPKLKSVLGP